MKKNSINLIFAVTAEQTQLYERLSELIEGSSCGTLSNDSSNVVELITEQYKVSILKIRYCNIQWTSKWIQNFFLSFSLSLCLSVGMSVCLFTIIFLFCSTHPSPPCGDLINGHFLQVSITSHWALSHSYLRFILYLFSVYEMLIGILKL